MEELTWIPIYIDKLLAGADHMTAAEFGGYMKLIFYQYKKGFVPADLRMLRKIAHLNTKQLSGVLEKFEPDADGNLINPACHIVREKQLERYRNKAENGRKGANVTNSKLYGKTTATPLASERQSNADKRKEKEDITTNVVTEREYQRPRVFLKENKTAWLHELEMKSSLGAGFETCIEQWSLKEEAGSFNYTADAATDARRLCASLQKWINYWLLNDRNRSNAPPGKNNTRQHTDSSTQNNLQHGTKTIGRINEQTAHQYLNRRNTIAAQADTTGAGATQNGTNSARPG